jgi:hypothetical protein
MNYKRYILLFCLLKCVILLGYSQKNASGIPFTFTQNVSRNNVNIKYLPYIDNIQEKKRADSVAVADCSGCGKSYYGKGVNMNIDMKSDGKKTILSDSSKVWLIKIQSSSAYGLQFYFDRFELPEGASLFIFNEDSSMVLGAFTYENNPSDPNRHIKFGTRYIKGNTVYVEYRVPADADFEGEVRITNIIHIFKNIFDDNTALDLSGSCQRNVACPEGAGWEKEIKSVVLIHGYDPVNVYAEQCTGTLINNTKQDGDALILTAKHCIKYAATDPSYDYHTWLFLFNHQGDQCTTLGSEVTKNFIDSRYGAEFLAGDGGASSPDSPTSDYLLLRIEKTTKEDIAKIGGCYAGWTLSSNHTPPYVLIHHPNGDIKKINYANNNLTSTDWAGSSVDPTFSYWRIPKWNSGSTENISSGGPVFNSEHLIIGQHRGGFSDCTTKTEVSNGFTFTYGPNEPDWAGKLSTSWNDPAFANALDPEQTNQNSIGSFCPVSTVIGGGGTGTGGNPLPCNVSMGTGMKVNTDKIIENIACVDGEFLLSPIGNTNDDCIPQWHFYAYSDVYNCDNIPSNLNSSLCQKKLLRPWKCECWFFNYFIEITEVDKYFSPIDIPRSKWITIQGDGNVFNGPNNDYIITDLNVYLKRIRVNPDLLNQIPVILKMESYYRIKIAAIGNGYNQNNGWKEDVRVFRVMPKDIVVSGDVYDNLYASNNIQISNTTVNNYINVVAGESIKILPNTILKAGSYRIEEVDCVESQDRIINTGTTSDASNDTFIEQQINHNTNQNNTSLNNNTLFTLSPSTGKFTVVGSSELGLGSVYVYNTIGQMVFSQTISNGEGQSGVIDITHHPAGIYFVRIFSSAPAGEGRGEVFLQKVVKE